MNEANAGLVVDREGGWVRRRARYAAGLLDGESLRFGDLGAPLFVLDSRLRPALESGALAPLRPAFEGHGLPLAAEAQFLVDDPGAEWRIVQPDGMLTVRRQGDGLPVCPGRVVQRTDYAAGEVVQRATYEGGRLHGRLTWCRPPSPPAAPHFALPAAARGALDGGDVEALIPAFREGGHDLQAGADVSVIDDDREWFIAQAGQTYSVRWAEGPAQDGLRVYSGRVASRATFREGLLDGETALYDEQGGLLRSLGFRQGRLDGRLIVYRDGRPQSASEYRDGRLHGELVTYDDRGQPATVATYRDGQQSGPLRLIERGEPRVVSAYLEGRPHGQTVVYQPDGKEWLVAPYREGQLEGERLIYSADGRPLQRSEYAGGMLHGQTIDYYPSGQVRQVSHYGRDQLDGPLYVYDPDGRLTEERVYQEGTLVLQRERGSWLGRLWQT
jgi:antitoxin component YwqK of YwqJK toxin-antitoxin module